MNKEIIIIDSICGSGKTQYAIQMINETENRDKKYIYITPFLDEVKRIKKNTNRHFYEPDYQTGRGKKYNHFRDLILDGKNIVSTHSLFINITEDILDSIIYNNYTLILDEVINVIENKYVTENDWEILVNNFIEIEECTNKIIWTEAEYSGRFDEIKNLANGNNLYLHTRSKKSDKGKTLLVWTFPIEVFKAFSEVYNLTYMFDAQLQKYYFDMYNQKYVYKSIKITEDRYELCDYLKSDLTKYKNLINIYDGENLNTIGNEYSSLSKSWFEKSMKRNTIKVLKNNICNYFINIINGKSKYNMWTVYKGVSELRDNIRLAVTGDGYSRGFLSCNARATNNYSHKYNCAYLLNKFMNPIDRGFFEDKGIKCNEDLYSVSELIQWLFRSRLRKDEPINLYIPSRRMRELLIRWMNNEF